MNELDKLSMPSAKEIYKECNFKTIDEGLRFMAIWNLLSENEKKILYLQRVKGIPAHEISELLMTTQQLKRLNKAIARIKAKRSL